MGGVPNLHDIRTVTNKRLAELGIAPEEITVVSAGFPCQPYSLAGKGKGDRDERDLWGEVARVLREIKPRWFVGENTPGLFSRENQRYFRRILSDLTEMGYRVGWGIWGACDVGAPHKRDRVFLLAYAYGERRDIYEPNGEPTCPKVGDAKAKTPCGTGSILGDICNAYGNGRSASEAFQHRACSTLAQSRRENKSFRTNRVSITVSDTNGAWKHQQNRSEQKKRERAFNSSWWQTEPDVGRVAHGVPARVDKLRCLGNAVVPYQAFPLFEAIAEFEKEYQ